MNLTIMKIDAVIKFFASYKKVSIKLIHSRKLSFMHYKLTDNLFHPSRFTSDYKPCSSKHV